MRWVVLGIVSQVVRGRLTPLGNLVTHERLNLLLPLVIIRIVVVPSDVPVGRENDEPDHEGAHHQPHRGREGDNAGYHQPLDEEVDAEDAEEDDGGGPQHQDLQHGEDQPGQRQASNSAAGTYEEEQVQKDVETSNAHTHQSPYASLFIDAVEQLPELDQSVLSQLLPLVRVLQHKLQMLENRE